jgi:putative endonuclease
MKIINGSRQSIGKWGEEVARNFLVDQGVVILDSNIRTQFGEIDILGMEGDALVFFEIKTRFSKKYGFPEIAVDKNKAHHMIQSALKYLQDHDEINHEWRIDVIAITRYINQPQIKWFKNAIRD